MFAMARSSYEINGGLDLTPVLNRRLLKNLAKEIDAPAFIFRRTRQDRIRVEVNEPHAAAPLHQAVAQRGQWRVSAAGPIFKFDRHTGEVLANFGGVLVGCGGDRTGHGRPGRARKKPGRLFP